MTERVLCKTLGCSRTILPSTAERTGGYCIPCANRAAAEAHARELAARRVDVDRFAGVSDVVEILRLLHKPPAPDPEKRFLPYNTPTPDVYRGLEQWDADRLVLAASTAPDFVRDVAVYLAAFSNVDLLPVQRALLAIGDPYPAAVFRAASSPVVDRLFALLETSIGREDALALDHTLSALAWARSRRVVEAMVDWSRNRPSWGTMLDIAPHEYATVAGYAIEDGVARDLILDSPVRLVAPPDEATREPAVVFESDPRGGGCPLCARPAVSLLSMRGDALPDRFRGKVPERVPTCPDCASYGPLFVHLAADGGWSWLPTERPPATPGASWDLAPARATFAPRAMWEAVDWCRADGLSQIGGHPSWINDPVYPRCPTCSRLMMTVAQIALEDFVRHAEGIFYVHYCSGCSVAGVSYDQS